MGFGLAIRLLPHDLIKVANGKLERFDRERLSTPQPSPSAACPEAYKEDLSRFRFIEEQAKDKEEKLIVSYEDGSFKVSALPVDLEPNVEREFFEKGWGPYLLKRVRA